MENTLENKSKFFAQYWGQDVLLAKTNGGYYKRITVSSDNMHSHYFNYPCYLELTPLSQITDEDARDLCRKLTSNFSDDSIASVQGRAILNKFRGQSVLWGEDWEIIISFLRSKGYALSYGEISVEELIARGWVQLKTV